MKLVRKLIQFCVDKKYRFNILASCGFYNHEPDEKYIKHKFKLEMGYDLNLDNPQTFNEKLQWLKLHDRNPLYTTMVDKYRVKEYVANIIGPEYIIPTLGVWDSPDDIDFDKLPNQFVLKCNHNSGLGLCICTDKSNLNIKKVKKALAKGLKQDYYLTNREWPYKDVPRKIIAEKYMCDKNQPELIDYKFYVFNGVPKFLYISQGLSNHATAHISFLNMDWTFAPFSRTDYKPFAHLPVKPVHFEQMCQLAKVLSKDIPFVRVDFYEIAGYVYFGELTFYPCAGLMSFYPTEWDHKIGAEIKLVHSRGK